MTWGACSNRVLFSIFHQVRDFEDEGSVSASVLTYMLAINKYIGYTVYSVETKKKTFTFPFGVDVQSFLVVANTSFIIYFAGKCVLCIPGVRQVHPPGVSLYLMRKTEIPVIVE